MGNLRTRNEDAVFCNSHRQLWAVAHGMGAHNAGDYASEDIAQASTDLHLGNDLSDCVGGLEDAQLEAHDHLRRHARMHCNGQTAGSMVVALVARGDTGVALWGGDSRSYRIRSRELRLITRDHNPISDLVDSFAVSVAEALAAQTNIITLAIGGQCDLHLDVAVFDVQQERCLVWNTVRRAGK